MLKSSKKLKLFKENKFYQTILFLITIYFLFMAIAYIPESYFLNPNLYYIVYWTLIVFMIVGIYLLYNTKLTFSRIFLVIISPIVYYAVISGIIINFDPSGAYFNWKFLGWYLIIILLTLPFELLLTLDYFTKFKSIKKASIITNMLLLIVYLVAIIFGIIRGISFR